MKEIIGDFTYNGKNQESTAKKVIINILPNNTFKKRIKNYLNT